MRRLLLLATVTACTTTSSTDVLTSEIYAAINAETKGDGKTIVSTTLYVDSPLSFNFVELGGGDSLVAKTAGVSKTMVEREVLNTVIHRAEFDIAAPGTIFEVVFDRDVDAGAPRSLATIPAAFDLTAPPSTMSRAAPLTLTWAPAGGPDGMSWLARGDCIEDATGAIMGDTGTVTIEPARLKQRMGAGIAAECPVTFTIQRAKPGALDDAYEAGTIHGTQSRDVVITSTL